MMESEDEYTGLWEGGGKRRILLWWCAALVLAALVVGVRRADRQFLRITHERLRIAAIVAWVVVLMVRDCAAVLVRFATAFVSKSLSDMVTFPLFYAPSSYTTVELHKKEQEDKVAVDDEEADGADDCNVGDYCNGVEVLLCRVSIPLLPLYSMDFGIPACPGDVDLFDDDAPPSALKRYLRDDLFQRPGTATAAAGGAGGVDVSPGPSHTPLDPNAVVRAGTEETPHQIPEAVRRSESASAATSADPALFKTAWDDFSLRVRLIWMWFNLKCLGFFAFGLWCLVAEGWREASQQVASDAADSTTAAGWVVAIVQSLAVTFTLLTFIFACYLFFNPLGVLLCGVALPLARVVFKSPESPSDVLSHRLGRLLVGIAWGFIQFAAVQCVLDYWAHVLRRSLERLVQAWRPSFEARHLQVRMQVFRVVVPNSAKAVHPPFPAHAETAARLVRRLCSSSYCCCALPRNEKYCLAFTRKPHGA